MEKKIDRLTKPPKQFHDHSLPIKCHECQLVAVPDIFQISQPLLRKSVCHLSLKCHLCQFKMFLKYHRHLTNALCHFQK